MSAVENDDVVEDIIKKKKKKKRKRHSSINKNDGRYQCGEKKVFKYFCCQYGIQIIHCNIGRKNRKNKIKLHYKMSQLT